MTSSDLPFGSEFSPSNIDLGQLLSLAQTHNGNLRALEDAILAAYFASNDTSASNRAKRAMNARLGMKAYGLIDESAHLTDLGRELLSLTSCPDVLYARLARHILLNLYGMTLLSCIRDMQDSGETVNLTTLRQGLKERDIHYPRGGKHPSIMRLWLAKVGIFTGKRWNIDWLRVEDIAGVSSSDLDICFEFSPHQRAFLRTLANLDEPGPHRSNEVARLASITYNIEFPEKSLPNLVLKALEHAGYITTTKSTSGRGAKPFLVQATDKLHADIINPLLEQLAAQTNPQLIKLLRTPLESILQELTIEDRYRSGLALEALAFKLLRLLNLTYVGTRLRAEQTGGAEVDLVFESTALAYSRWQVQCKNAKVVSLGDVAREVGLQHLVKPNVIVVITTGSISEEARNYARHVTVESNLAVVLLDGQAVLDICQQPTRIARYLTHEATNTAKRKRLNL